MLILSIDTSCDETSVAVTNGRKIIVNKVFSQVLINKKGGGVVPNLARRAHEDRIDFVIEEALKRVSSRFDFIAVTYGPGLAPALEVGINKAKTLAKIYKKKLIAVNHLEGHIYSCFAQNSAGNPQLDFKFPYLSLIVSGGHTELAIFKDHLDYKVIGETIDDAAGEALDKAAKLLGLGYPGGEVIERLAKQGDPKYHFFPRPMSRTLDLNFSFSGLKTSFYYYVTKMSDTERHDNLYNFAASYQEAVFESIIKKLQLAFEREKTVNLIVGGGVIANRLLRKKIRDLSKKYNGQVLFPVFKTLYGDNAAMIGIAAYYRALKNQFVDNLESLDRIPRARLDSYLDSAA